MTARTVTVSPPGSKAVTSLTEYAYDPSGRLSGMSLPDGSMLEYRRNGQGQVVSLERHRIRTSWLRWLQSPEVIVRDLERDIVGLRSAAYGNGVRARYQRSAQGVLARVDYRAPPRVAPAAGMTLALSVLSGARPAAAARARAAGLHTGPNNGFAAAPALPGALGHARDRDALLDHRYLWDAEGKLLLQEAADRTSSYAYDAQDRLVASATVPATRGACREQGPGALPLRPPGPAGGQGKRRHAAPLPVRRPQAARGALRRRLDRPPVRVPGRSGRGGDRLR
ncbi:hypothetical protein [Massilia varians]|uniref:hypothetical protein n=1 Tax=Massilia varians TaxID=457921 RepID=UPI0024935AA8|nr:hypothetical protein [Massilia varians]